MSTISVGTMPQDSQSGMAMPSPSRKPDCPPTRELRNSEPQASAVAKLGIMNGNVAISPMVRRNGTSVITTSQARKPPIRTQPEATPTPRISVLPSGTQSRLRDSRPVVTSLQAMMALGDSVSSTMRKRGAAISTPTSASTLSLSTVMPSRRRPRRRARLDILVSNGPPGTIPGDPALGGAYCSDSTRSPTSWRISAVAAGSTDQAMNSSSGTASGWSAMSLRVA
jgi:hypothetical protein